MPAGLETYDPSGNLSFRVTDRITRVVGTVYTGTVDGSIAVPLYATVGEDARWFTIVQFLGGGEYTPIITTTSNGLYWAFRANRYGFKEAAWITYGVY